MYTGNDDKRDNETREEFNYKACKKEWTVFKTMVSTRQSNESRETTKEYLECRQKVGEVWGDLKRQ